MRLNVIHRAKKNILVQFTIPGENKCNWTEKKLEKHLPTIISNHHDKKIQVIEYTDEENNFKYREDLYEKYNTGTPSRRKSAAKKHQ